MIRNLQNILQRCTLQAKLSHVKHTSLSFKECTVSTMPDCSVEIREAKTRLRLEVKNRLKNLTQTEKLKQTFIITSRIVTHPDFQNAKRIAIYLNMKNEVGTFDILQEAFNGKKQVYIPLVVGSDMKMVRLDSMDELKAMPKSKWGIIQPMESDEREDCLETGGVNYVVVPGVAFTSTGLRLGHGKGYYDRFLAENDRITGSRCITVGVGFNEQIVDELPTNENDFRLTWVVYPEMSSLFSKHIEIPSEFKPPPEPFII
ncbi:5-formyltetrahydrofolate cyclo-ligase [Macrosteles quadrilineatus]|uniref:5-formyltetrahydrofolate cyclo-ligase n=1 Tax=Macrosteles quadrilineatus TaxID=74068 RepID=UPI0023E0CC82|nr:5-formyltetrahydrofolate cyclo-ligase [Macrosteles quadrilineatus]